MKSSHFQAGATPIENVFGSAKDDHIGFEAAQIGQHNVVGLVISEYADVLVCLKR